MDAVGEEYFQMGFLDKIKKAFDTGGVSVDIQAPQQFRWSEGTLPVSLTLKGHESESRTITSILFRLQEADNDSDRNQSARDRKRDGIRYEYTDPIVLAAGESVTIDIDFPLSIGEVLDGVGATGEVPGWLATAAKVIDTGMKLSTESSIYRISATPTIEGAKIAKGVSRQIRQAGLGDVFVGNLL